MKIVSVMTTDSRGGAEFAAVEMLDALVERGHAAVMLSDQPQIARNRRVEVRPLDIGPKLSTSSYLSLAARWPLLVRRLRAALEREAPYDVLLVHYKKEQLMTLNLPKRLLANTVWAEWGPVPFPLRKGIPRKLYLAAGERANVVLAISAGTKHSVCEVGVPAAKVFVVPNVLRTDEIDFTAEGRARVRGALGIGELDFVIGCISRFHPKKRNDVVVQAALKLDGAHLIMAGDGETEAELRELAGPLGARAHFIDTPGANVADALSAFDVSVFCPSPTEGAPRAVILGMLARRPCLATGGEGVADIITPEIGAITAPENDADALAATLRRYIGDPQLGPKQGATARRLAEETYAAPVVAATIERLVQGTV